MLRSGATAMLTLVLLGSTVACGDRGTEPGQGVTVVATTSILGDVVGAVVGDQGTVEVLMPVGADPHDYEPSAQQVAAVHRADLVVTVGLGLEQGLIEALEAAAGEGTAVLELGPRLDPIAFGGHQYEEGGEDEVAEPGGDDLDPHIWMDPLRMTEATRLIAEALAEIAPEVDWSTRAAAYAAELEAAHASVEETLAGIPEARRKLVTNHDALGYFADRYRFQVVGVVIPGGSTLAEPSSEDLAELVGVIRSEGVAAIFAETTHPSDLAAAIAAEVGDEDFEVVELYTGSLGPPGSGADTLVGMLLTDADLIAAALS